MRPLDPGDRSALLKQLNALELRLIDLEWKAQWAFEAEQRRSRDSLAFWTFLYKATVLATVVLAWALVLFGSR